MYKKTLSIIFLTAIVLIPSTAFAGTPAEQTQNNIWVDMKEYPGGSTYIKNRIIQHFDENEEQSLTNIAKLRVAVRVKESVTTRKVDPYIDYTIAQGCADDSLNDGVFKAVFKFWNDNGYVEWDLNPATSFDQWENSLTADILTFQQMHAGSYNLNGPNTGSVPTDLNLKSIEIMYVNNGYCTLEPGELQIAVGSNNLALPGTYLEEYPGNDLYYRFNVNDTSGIVPDASNEDLGFWGNLFRSLFIPSSAFMQGRMDQAYDAIFTRVPFSYLAQTYDYFVPPDPVGTEHAALVSFEYEGIPIKFLDTTDARLQNVLGYFQPLMIALLWIGFATYTAARAFSFFRPV